MASDLYAYSITLKGRIQSSGQISELLNLDSSSSIESIKDAYSQVGRNTSLKEYWCCIFLLSCEDNGPCIPILNLNVFLNYFREALAGVSGSDVHLKKLYADCVDGILLNELIELNDDDTKIRVMAQILEVFIEFEGCFDRYEFSFKKQAECVLSYLWGKISIFNTGECPSSEIVQVTRDVWIAARAGLNTNDVGYPMADPIIEYIDYLNNHQLDDPQARLSPEKIQTSHEMINQLEEFCQDNEVKAQVREMREKLNKFSSYQAVGQLPRQAPPSTPSRDSIPFASLTGILKSSDIQIIDEGIYATKKREIRVKISKGIFRRMEVCVKTYTAPNNLQELKAVENEINIFNTLSVLSNDSNCFIRYHGTILEEKSVKLVMDWYPHDLNEIINSRSKTKAKITENTFVDIVYSLVSSFSIMAGNRIFHNDIKPHNILAKNPQDGWILKIIDFDVSFIKNNDIKSSTTQVPSIQGTEGWISPQKLKREKFDPEKSDVYSLGLVLYQFLTYKNVQNTSLQQMYHDIDDLGFTETTRNFLKALLTYDESQRPTFGQSLSQLEIVKRTVRQTTSALNK